ncbi:MAG TPA: hypothetical protein DCR93_21995 [Cytophagales bacterium]|nr:hypothetical protein [Cytophagales bacterium]HAP62053.1 hypothetical protein [Cytophagales bacterium]
MEREGFDETQLKQFAKALDITWRSLYNWRDSENWSTAFYQAIGKEFPDYNLHWLITGNGPMLISEYEKTEVISFPEGTEDDVKAENIRLREECNLLQKKYDDSEAFIAEIEEFMDSRKGLRGLFRK